MVTQMIAVTATAVMQSPPYTRPMPMVRAIAYSPS